VLVINFAHLYFKIFYLCLVLFLLTSNFYRFFFNGGRFFLYCLTIGQTQKNVRAVKMVDAPGCKKSINFFATMRLWMFPLDFR
jgi:hypothetical protein